MIRYWSYGAKNFRLPSAQSHVRPLEVEYRELLELRERVREAEAVAAKRVRSRCKSKLKD
jgi:hypothetical protein